MIVVAIIGILAAIAIPQFSAYRIKALNANAQADLRNGMAAEEAYFSVYKNYFSIAFAASSASQRNSTLGIHVSPNVDFSLTGSAQDYTGSSRHTKGDHTYTITGSVGLIR